MLLGALLLALAPSALPAQTTAQARPVPIAITASGLRLECVDTRPGDRLIRTPFGNLSVPTDPVAEVADGKDQLEGLLALHAQGALDDLGLLQDLATAGQLSALVQHAQDLARREPDRLEPYLALEAWGARLDPVPRELPHDQRVDWLWKQVWRGQWHETVLAGARLREEVSEAFQPYVGQTVGIADLRKALRRSTPQHRRAAALVAGKQQEFSMRESFLVMSLLETNDAARDGACWAANQIHPHAARSYWARNLARGEGALRERAALALGHNAGAEGLKVLVHVLAAHDRHVAERFSFAGRVIWVVAEADSTVRSVQDFLRPRQELDVRTYPTDREYLDLGSTFEVTKYKDDLTKALLTALDLWAGERTGRSCDDWLAWYQENYTSEKK